VGVDKHIVDMHAGHFRHFRAVFHSSETLVGDILGRIAGGPPTEFLVGRAERQFVFILLVREAVVINLVFADGIVVRRFFLRIIPFRTGVGFRRSPLVHSSGVLPAGVRRRARGSRVFIRILRISTAAGK